MKPEERISHQNNKSISSNSKNPTENKINNLLLAVTECTAVLLNDEDFDRGVSRALEILGTSIGADRINIGEQHDDPTDKTLGYIIIAPYEWLSTGTISQVHHSELNRINCNEIKEDYYELLAGNHAGGLIETFPEPFRSGQQKLEVKATYAIPIMVKGQYWGYLGLDFCRTARKLCEAEINLLKTAATCIGSAIQRERNRQAREQAERTALLERQKAEELQQRDRLLNITAQAVQALLNDEDLKLAIDRALDIIGQGINTDRVCVMEHHGDRDRNSLGALKIIYEWISDYAVSQSQHPQLHTISYEGIEDWYEQFKQGEAVGGDIDELPEAVREGQRELGVKSMYAVPIIVDGDYWGIIGFDHCREARLRSESEISILKATAACIGSAIQQHRIRQEREQAERTALLEHQKAAQLKEHNLVLEKRDRILTATAEASNVLLAEDNFDDAVNKALQIIGEAIDTDRVAVSEHFEDPYDRSLGYFRIIHEWDSPDTPSQLNHSELKTISYEGIEDIYQLLCKGEGVGYVVDELPEPIRSGQKEIGVKSTYSIPIMIGGKYWGIVGFDDCREVTRRSEAELSILKTAAACIGSAIQQERIRREKEAAERNVLLEREKAAIEKAEQLRESNLVLSLRDRWLEATANAANKLLENADLDTGINTALKVLGESLDCDRVCVMQHFEDDTVSYVQILHEWNSQSVSRQIESPEWVKVSWEGIDNWLVRQKAGDWIGGVVTEFPEPFRSKMVGLEVQCLYNVPIFINDNYWGSLGIDFCREARRLTLPEIAVFKTAASCIGSAIYRQQKDEALKKSEKRYRTLFELSNEGIYRFEFNEPIPTSLPIEERLKLAYRHNRIVIANHVFAKQYGFDNPEEVIGHQLNDFYLSNSEVNTEVNRKMLSGEFRVYNQETEESDRLGNRRYILGNVVAEVKDGYIFGGWGTQTDITELKQAQQDLLEAERQRVAQLEESNLVLSLRDRWLEATANAANKLLENADLDAGINAALKMLGESLDCDRVAIMQHIEDNTGETSGAMRQLYEWDFTGIIAQISYPEFKEIPNDGLEEFLTRVTAGKWIGGLLEEFNEPFYSIQKELGVQSTYAVPIFVGEIFWGILAIDFCREARRLTEPEIAVFKTAASCIGSAIYRQQIQEEKERAELAILNERNRMAREIHDTLAQAFTGITLQLEVARNSLTAESSTVAERLLKAKSLAQEGIKEARRSVRALRPEVLDSGLAIAIHQLADKMLSGTNIESEVSITGESHKLTSDVEVELFRIVQEAVTNTVRYAQASKISIELVSNADGVRLKIEDNGIGFDSQSLLNEGFGLIGMRERSDRLEGNIEINSAIGKGTEIIVAIAL